MSNGNAPNLSKASTPMPRPHSRRRLVVAVMTALVLGAAAAPAAQAQDEEPTNLITNGDFASGTTGWWSTENLTGAVADGEWCLDVPGGTSNAWDAIVGQNDLPLVAGESYELRFTARASADVSVRDPRPARRRPLADRDRGVPGPHRGGPVLQLRLHRQRRLDRRAARVPDRPPRRAVAVLPFGGPVAHRSRTARLRARHRAARAGQPGRVLPRRPQTGHTRHGRDRPGPVAAPRRGRNTWSPRATPPRTAMTPLRANQCT